MKYSVVTTFNAEGYEKYGRRMLQTFIQNWPSTVQLMVYAEDCVVAESAPNLQILDLAQASPELMAFKHKWKDVPWANGDISRDPARNQRKDAGKEFKWDAVRFSHKVYSIFHCANHTDADWLIWMDADTVCHSPIAMSDLARLCPSNTDLCFLGRRKKFSECGLYSMRLGSKSVKQFLQEFQRMYNDAENGIFLLGEWHDSFVFDVVRKNTPGLIELNWAAGLEDLRPSKLSSPGEGHPLINSEWGAYLDHLKGTRKIKGRSKDVDLKVQRTEAYWQ